MRRKIDPRTGIDYIRMGKIIDFLDTNGPHTMGYICRKMRITPRDFRAARYRLGGRLAMEDRGVTIPRPVSNENYKYKVASTYHTGDAKTDGEPGMQTSFSNILTSQATVYVDVEKVIAAETNKTTKKLLRKLQKSMDAVLDRMEDVAVDAGAPIGVWARTVLDRIA
jgi:hypothetical protein